MAECAESRQFAFDQSFLLGARPAFELSLSINTIAQRKRAFDVNEAWPCVIGRMFASEAEPVFSKAFTNVTGLANV